MAFHICITDIRIFINNFYSILRFCLLERIRIAIKRGMNRNPGVSPLISLELLQTSHPPLYVHERDVGLKFDSKI